MKINRTGRFSTTLITYTLFLFAFYTSIAQNKITGTIVSNLEKTIPNVEIYNKTNGTKYYTNSKGDFSI
jgi:hypothetical protein